MRRQTVSLACLLALALAGCTQQPTVVNSIFDAQINAPYTLGGGDRVRVLVYGQDSLSNSYAVDGSGHISMPLIGLVRAHGLTTAALERSIEARLRNGYLRDPKVAVEVEAFRPFFVMGEVTASGQFPYVNGMMAQNAIAIAGGFTPRGNQNSVELTRIIEGEPVTASVPLTFQVRPGDTITVKERFF